LCHLCNLTPILNWGISLQIAQKQLDLNQTNRS
jgi:hypothetical protein